MSRCTWCTPATQVTCPECNGTGQVRPRNPVLVGQAEKRVELPVEKIHYEASQLLGDIKHLFPPQYKLTLIARNTEIDKADVVLTEDHNTEAIKTALDNSTVRKEVV